MNGRSLILAAVASLALLGKAAAGANTTAAPPPVEPQQPTAEDTLTLLTLDVRTMPEALAARKEAPAPQWRTSFAAQLRNESLPAKPATAVDADLVLLQGVTDVPALRRWFPAGQWRLVVSRQLLASEKKATDVPSTAVAVRLRRGLRVTGQDHLTELSDALGKGPGEPPTAAGTAVRVLIDNRQTWAVSVLLPETCPADCPGRLALARWHEEQAAANVRRVTGGRFHTGDGTATAGQDGCASFGLKLDPPPPPPRAAYVKAAISPALGCAASISVAK